MTNETCTNEVLLENKLFRVRPIQPQTNGSDKKDRALVFVHGFLGDALTTWIKKDAVESFPSLLATDPLLSDYDIFLFQYVTKDFRPPRIANIADQLKFAIDQHIPGKRLVLLGHSMGGLVSMHYILKLLEQSDPKAQFIAGLLIYGCPMTGVEWAKYARLMLHFGEVKVPILGWVTKVVSANKQIDALTSGSEFIDSMNGKWVISVLNGGRAGVPAEQRAWFPVRVVTGNDDWVVKESSARGFYSERDWINADEDHRSLVKPANRLQMTYQIAKDFLVDSRTWIKPESRTKLRRQLDDISDVQRSKSISDWNFDVLFESKAIRVALAGFGITGFRAFEVRNCSYRFRMTQSFVKFGFAIGLIASGAIWNDEFAFLHRILFGALPVEESGPIHQKLQEVVASGQSGWSRVFQSVLLKVRKPEDTQWHNLKEESIEQVTDGFVRRYSLPQEALGLIGQEVEIDISFRSLLPGEITDYTVSFPWLCDSFRAQIALDASPAFLVDSQAMRGNPEFKVNKDQLGKIEYRSNDVIFPGSYIRFEWEVREP
jgi:pimeloyl-ACP methyl ester carboxylesterase